MRILDTDHYSEFQRGAAAGLRLRTRLAETDIPVFISVITAEETVAGWLPRLRGRHSRESLLADYTNFQEAIESLNEWIVLPWSMEASNIFDELRRTGVRIGTLDLRIACIALNYDAPVLTRNFVDFQQVPGLRVENWLD